MKQSDKPSRVRGVPALIADVGISPYQRAARSLRRYFAEPQAALSKSRLPIEGRWDGTVYATACRRPRLIWCIGR